MSTVTEASAKLVRRGEGTSVRWGPAGVVRIVAGENDTDSSFSICEVTEGPGSAAPLHVHHGEAEAFYVLEGRAEIACGETVVDAGPGDFVYAPRGVPHKYRVLGEQTLRMLLFFSRPGFESFFAEAGAPMDRPSGPPDPDAIRRVVGKYNLELLEAPAH